jgi:hypothetical protein
VRGIHAKVEDEYVHPSRVRRARRVCTNPDLRGNRTQ